MKAVPIFIFFLLFLVSTTFVGAQEKTISGVVTDQNSVPLPGVSIQVKGGAEGTTTDFNGNFSLQAQVGAVLNFSSLGFKTQEITIGEDDTLTVMLQEDTQALEEVIVTAFGRKLTRNESTSNVVSVGDEELQKSSFVNPQEGLQGKVSGLTVGSVSGVPGSAPEIRIRGSNSVTASNAPLYVLDGVPLNSDDISGSSSTTSLDPLSVINIDDIENITVLKDASAVAPYGAEGSNGVILITTKSGKLGKPRYTLSYKLGFQNRAIRGLRAMNSEQKMEAVEEAYWNSFGPEFGNGQMTSRDELHDFALDHSVFMAEWERQGRPYTDWYEDLRNKNALLHQANFSVSQGDEKSKFYASLGYNKTEATYIGTKFHRLNGLVKYSRQMSEKLDIDISATASNVDQDIILENSAYFDNPNNGEAMGSPWVSLYNEDGSFNIGPSFGDFTSMYNIPYNVKHNTRNNNVVYVSTNDILNYKLSKNLIFRSVLGLDYMVRYYKTYRNPNEGDGVNPNGDDSESAMRRYHYTTQNSLDYSFKIGEENNFRVTAVQEFSKYKSNFLTGYGSNMASEDLTNLSGASANYTANSTFSDRMSMRFVGLLNYNFNQKYLMDASYSYQGDSRFSSRWDSFYSVGLGWNLHKEPFFENIDKIETLRLKLGYGITGNAAIGRNQYQALTSISRYRDQPAATVTGYGTDAKWEKSRRMDLSLDYSFFNGRLKGSIGGYYNTTTDMLFQVPLPMSSTFLDGTVLRNLGEMDNKGFEFDISADIISTPDFNWNISGNVSLMSNKVTKLPEEANIISASRIVSQGHKVYEWYLPEFARINPDNGLPEWYIDRTVNDETTNDYTQAQRNYIGKNALPTYYGGLSMRFDYKHLFLDASLFFQGGNRIFEQWLTYRQSTIGSNVNSFNTSVDAFEGAWREPGDQATYARFDFNNSSVSNFVQNSTRWLHNGAYMRLRDIGIGYSFDQKMLESIGFFSGIDIVVRGTNLWTWVKDKTLKYDPEVGNSGLTTLATPPIKSVTMQINLKF